MPGCRLRNSTPELHVERVVFEDDGRFVVVGPRVHRQHEEAAPGELARRDVRQEVRRPVNQEHRDVRRWTPGDDVNDVGPVERAFHRRRRELHVRRIALRARSRRRQRRERDDDKTGERRKMLGHAC